MYAVRTQMGTSNYKNTLIMSFIQSLQMIALPPRRSAITQVGFKFEY